MSVVVARIGKPHGIRGEVTVEARTDDPQRRFVGGAVFDTEAAPGTGVPRRLTLASARLHQRTWLLAFEEIPDRTGAESLRGTLLTLPEDAVGEDGPDDEGWYEDDLVGLAVEDAAGAPVGMVSGLVVGPAQDLLEVRLPDGRTALVPFVEQLVPVVDVEGRRIVIDPPAGLLDLAE